MSRWDQIYSYLVMGCFAPHLWRKSFILTKKVMFFCTELREERVLDMSSFSEWVMYDRMVFIVVFAILFILILWPCLLVCRNFDFPHPGISPFAIFPFPNFLKPDAAAVFHDLEGPVNPSYRARVLLSRRDRADRCQKGMALSDKLYLMRHLNSRVIRHCIVSIFLLPIAK